MYWHSQNPQKDERQLRMLLTAALCMAAAAGAVLFSGFAYLLGWF